MLLRNRKLRIIHKKLRFHGTSETCKEATPIRIVRYRTSHVTFLGLLHIRHESEKHGKKHGFGVIGVSAQKTSNQDGLLRDQAASKVTHYSEITKFPWPTFRMCTGVLRTVYCCLKSKSCSPPHPYEYTSGKQYTRHIACFRCYLNLCVHWTWNQAMLLSDQIVP